MKLTDINQNIKPPEGAIFVRSDVRQGWFVIVYQTNELMTEIYCNQNGREVFRVNYQRPSVAFFRYLWKVLKETYADPDTSTQV